MAQTQRISKNNTTINKSTPGITIVTLHSTPVVTIDRNANTVTFNNGGWVTATTATRITQVCNEYDLIYCVGRKQGVMHVDNRVTQERINMDKDSITLPLKFMSWDANASKFYERA